MRGVSGVSKGGAVAGARRAARSSGGFPLGGANGSGAAAEATAASATAAVAGLSLLAVQEDAGARAGRDAAARRRASSILDELQGLQAELLGGRPDPSRLARLAALQSGEAGADPGLRAAVRAISLRARIELARRGGGADRHRSDTVP